MEESTPEEGEGRGREREKERVGKRGMKRKVEEEMIAAFPRQRRGARSPREAKQRRVSEGVRKPRNDRAPGQRTITGTATTQECLIAVQRN